MPGKQGQCSAAAKRLIIGVSEDGQ